MPILQRSRRPGQSHAAASSSGANRMVAAPAAELPPYEPPMYPLDAGAKQMLASLSDNRNNRKLQQQISKSMKYLQDSAVSLNDHLTTRRTNAPKRQTNQESQEKTDEDLEQEKRFAEFEAKVVQLTKDHEAAFRELIGYRNECEDEKDATKVMREEVDAQQPKVRPPRPAVQNRAKKGRAQQRRNGSEDEEDEAEADELHKADAQDEPQDLTPYAGASELLKKARQTKAEEYLDLSMQERYAKDNDYIDFRKNLHYVMNDDEVPLPHASKWFDKDGNPTFTARAGAGAGDDDDDDVVVEREIIDIRCPLSGSIMEDPWSSRECNHTFEKSWIFPFIAQAGLNRAKCPVCSRLIRKQDLFEDRVMLKRIKNSQKKEHNSDDDEGGAENVDEFMDIPEAQVKNEPAIEDVED